MHIIEELQARNQVADVTHEKELKELLAGGDAVPFYAGFDPTATSLHLGTVSYTHLTLPTICSV